MLKLILISGKAGNGKTTAANMIKEILETAGNKVVVTRYAYYLKDLAKRYCNWDGNKDDYGRTLLQTLGTDIIREKLNKKNFHVSRICEDIEICQDYVDYVIIDDVRFENEVYYPKALFGNKVLTIRIDRLDEDGSIYKSPLSEKQKNHISETALDNFYFDKTLHPRSKRDLKNQIEKYILPIL